MPARPASTTAKKSVGKRTPTRATAKPAPKAAVKPSPAKARAKPAPALKAAAKASVAKTTAKPAVKAKAAPPARALVKSKAAPKAKPAPAPRATRAKAAAKPQAAPVSRKQKVKEMAPTKESAVPKIRVDGELEKFRDLLLSERTRLLAELEEIESRTARTSDAERATELSSYEDHPADLASETFEREKDLAIAESVESLLNQVNTALEKVDRGTYGVCDACSRPIKKARLQALPFATLCLECQGRLEG
jgi:RNA polymerase-binding protein DksA